MPRNIHKGTELNNVRETWEQNERRTTSSAPDKDELERAVEEEASEYDQANKEERLLGGDRASVKDEDALRE